MTPPPASAVASEARALLASAERRTLALASHEVALLDFGGDGPLALFHHANGFCKGVLALLADRLRDRFRIVAMDARGHGDSGTPAGPDPFAWKHFADDVSAVALRLPDQLGSGPVSLGLGHSFGGTSMLLGARAHPERFGRLVLVDPVVPPPPGVLPPGREEHVAGMVDRARKRRADWPSREEARTWWQEREFFADWDPRALELYLQDGLRQAADGGVELKCSPEVEAAVFARGEGVDVPAAAVGHPVPALFLWAERGNFPRAGYEALVARMQRGRVETVKAGHLAPMEAPEIVAEAVRRFAAEETPA